VALLTTGCATTLKQVTVSDKAVKIERETQADIALPRFMDKQKRLYSLSYPMLVASGELFPKEVIPAYGFMMHDKDLYGTVLGKEYKEAAIRHGIDEHVTVRYVHPESPAELADLRVGDRILAINEQFLDDENAIDTMSMMHKLDYPEERLLELLIEREGQTKKLAIEGVPAGKYSVQMVNDDIVNAFANSKEVLITTGMMRFCEADNELAFVVGHEIAHIALVHQIKDTINRIPGMIVDIIIFALTGVDTEGAFSDLSNIVFKTKAFELEADYAGLYILARAGYDITGAANFFRHMAIEHPRSIRSNFLATHPSTPERFVSIENTVREIDEKRQNGESLIPEKKND
jgi:hypothetical protein